MPKKHIIGKLSDFPKGRGRTVEIDDLKIAVFRTEAGIYAMDNTCPHEEGPLGDGMVDAGKVTCPQHGWAFDIKSGQCEMFEPVKVKTYPIEVEGDDVILAL